MGTPVTAARNAGAMGAGYVVLRLPWAVGPLFLRWLDEHFPDRKEKVLSRIHDLRDGKLYQAEWGVRGRGEGVFAKQIATLFDVTFNRPTGSRGWFAYSRIGGGSVNDLGFRLLTNA